ncbi:DUF2607 family protein [Pseudomonas sp. SG20056]|uniref:DUF2607 family protein n=1 Tax=Pseudomonas sp. SG20056 TaxID=3074146 RepID=UPI0038F7D5C0
MVPRLAIAVQVFAIALQQIQIDLRNIADALRLAPEHKHLQHCRLGIGRRIALTTSQAVIHVKGYTRGQAGWISLISHNHLPFSSETLMTPSAGVRALWRGR